METRLFGKWVKKGRWQRKDVLHSTSKRQTRVTVSVMPNEASSTSTSPAHSLPGAPMASLWPGPCRADSCGLGRPKDSRFLRRQTTDCVSDDVMSCRSYRMCTDWTLVLCNRIEGRSGFYCIPILHSESVSQRVHEQPRQCVVIHFAPITKNNACGHRASGESHSETWCLNPSM